MAYAASPLSDLPQPKRAASARDHDTVLAAARAGVGQFSTRAGPDGGNLACVWAVRHLIRATLGYWITLSDSTDQAAAELLAHFGASFAESDVPAGGIIVSPSEGAEGTPERIVGHIGLLGAGSGDNRIVYSNRSADAVWMDHYSLATWQARYRDGKGLAVLFFPIPDRGPAAAHCANKRPSGRSIALDLAAAAS